MTSMQQRQTGLLRPVREVTCGLPTTDLTASAPTSTTAAMRAARNVA